MTSETRRQFKKWLLLNFLGGMLVGVVGMVVAMEFGPSLDLVEPHLLGLFVAFLLAVMGLYTVAASTRIDWTAKVMGTTADEGDDLAPERKALRWQGVVTVLAALELLILCFGTDYMEGERGQIVFALLLAVMAIQTWLNFRLWREGDEFFRRIIVETGVAAFVAFQFLIFFWAAASRFGYVEDPTALDIYVLLMAVYLGASGIVAVRRGYGVPA
jgi:hypothetical protein